MTTAREAAHLYAARGWQPILLHGVNGDGLCTCRDRGKPGHETNAGKHPTENDWAAAEPIDIDASYAGWRSNHNVGIKTGTPSGFFVIDVDPEHGGRESLLRLQDDHEKLSPSAVQRTGSGGWHLLFKMPEDFDIGNSKGGLKAYPGIDVRGTGGQIVAWPSRSAKGDYTWLAEADPQPAPEWLLELLRPKEHEGTAVVVPSQQKVPLDNIDDAEAQRLETYSARVRDLEVGRLVAMTEAAKVQPYVGEPWNQTVYNVACALIELANSPWTLYDHEQAALDLFHNAPQDDGFGRMEIDKCWRSATSKVGENARAYPVARPDTRSEISSWMTEPGVRVDPVLLKGATPPPGVTVGETEAPARPPVPMRTWDDLGNAMRVVDHLGRGLRWVDEAEQWALYKEGRWHLVKPNVVQGLIQRIIDERIMQTEGQHYSNVPDDDDHPEDTERTAFEKWLKAQRMTARIAAAQKEATGRHELYARLSDFDGDPMLLNVVNGIVDLRTGTLGPHDPSKMLMRQSPVTFDAAAKAPLWEAFLERVQPDPEMRAYLQRILGYTISGDTREQALFLWHGDGANGKSIASSIMGAIMGDYGQTVAPSTLLSGDRDEHPTGIAMMDGRRWLPATETAPGRRLDEEKVKNLTGGEPVAARFMGKDFFEFVPVGKIHLITNHLPRLSDAKSIWRRIHLVLWGVTIPLAEQDRLLEAKLRAELPGILTWLVHGAQQWQQIGLAPPRAALEDLAGYRDDSDVFGDFLRTHTLTATPEHKTPAQALYEAYQGWCFRQGVKRPMSMQAFVATMAERKFVRYRDSSGRGFRGVVPVTPAIAPLPWKEDA